MEAQSIEALRNACLPVAEELGLDLYDVEMTGNGRARVVRVSLDRRGGIDTESLEAASRLIDPIADELIPGAFLLEVSSPGLERPLRRPEHYRTSIRMAVSIKYRNDSTTVRERGILIAATDDVITVDVGGTERTIAYDEIVNAHSVFEWGGAAKPGSAKSGSSKSGSADKANPKRAAAKASRSA